METLNVSKYYEFRFLRFSSPSVYSILEHSYTKFLLTKLSYVSLLFCETKTFLFRHFDLLRDKADLDLYLILKMNFG